MFRYRSRDNYPHSQCHNRNIHHCQATKVKIIRTNSHNTQAIHLITPVIQHSPNTNSHSNRQITNSKQCQITNNSQQYQITNNNNHKLCINNRYYRLKDNNKIIS